MGGVPTSATRANVVVVMPAYNAARTLAETYQRIPAGIVREVILVDDFSKDATADIATGLGIRVMATFLAWRLGVLQPRILRP